MKTIDDNKIFFKKLILPSSHFRDHFIVIQVKKAISIKNLKSYHGKMARVLLKFICEKCVAYLNGVFLVK